MDLVNEGITIDEGYESNEVKQAIKQHEKGQGKGDDTQYNMRLQITGDNGAKTKWLNVLPSTAVKIADLLEKEKKY